MKNATRLFALALALCCLTFTGLALASETPADAATPLETPAPTQGKTISLSGQVVAGETITLTAPFGGTVEDFTVREGDLVEAGQALFEIETEKLYAPCDGVVSGVRTAPGDDAAYVQEQYGALLYIEPASAYTISTSTSGAYDSNENKIVHVGETVYLVSSSSKSRTGTGFITSVDGTNYTVEVTDGNLRLDERVNIYREEDLSSRSLLGNGRTERINPIAITGEGSVLNVLVAEGATVQRGDVLAELVEGTLPGLAQVSTHVTTPSEGLIAEIKATPGEGVSSGAVLATFSPLESLQVAATVYETDIAAIAVGDSVQLEFLGLKDHDMLEGTVASISAVSQSESGDAQYTAYIDFTPDVLIREGMTATVYLER